MKHFEHLSEQEVDRLFAGQPTPAPDLVRVSQFVQKARSTFLTDVEPEVEAAHLAGLMRTVHLTDKGDLAARPASKVTGPGIQASGLPTRRRIMLESLFASLAAKLAVGGISVAMATTGLAATGNLPDAAQAGLSDAVANIGIEIPNPKSAERAIEKADRVVEKAAVKAEKALEKAGDKLDGGDDATEPDKTKAPNEKASFGQSVSADARDGGVSGREISEAAHDRNDARKAADEPDDSDGRVKGAGDGDDDEVDEPDDSDGRVDSDDDADEDESEDDDESKDDDAGDDRGQSGRSGSNSGKR